MRPAIYAHRGSSGDAPENTMAAFRLALKQGAEGIELDVHRSMDGRIVVIHDETLNRTTNGSGYVVSHTYDYIRRLDASCRMPAYHGEPVPVLEEVLELVADTALELNIELKNDRIFYEGLEEDVIRIVRKYGMERRVVLSSFNHKSILRLHELAPELEGAILYSAAIPHPSSYAKRFGARSLHPKFSTVDLDTVKAAHSADMKIRPYTVNKEKDMRKMIKLGVDAIITNYPALLKRVLEEQRDDDGQA